MHPSSGHHDGPMRTGHSSLEQVQHRCSPTKVQKQHRQNLQLPLEYMAKQHLSSSPYQQAVLHSIGPQQQRCRQLHQTVSQQLVQNVTADSNQQNDIHQFCVWHKQLAKLLSAAQQQVQAQVHTAKQHEQQFIGCLLPPPDQQLKQAHMCCIHQQHLQPGHLSRQRPQWRLTHQGHEQHQDQQAQVQQLAHHLLHQQQQGQLQLDKSEQAEQQHTLHLLPAQQQPQQQTTADTQTAEHPQEQAQQQQRVQHPGGELQPPEQNCTSPVIRRLAVRMKFRGSGVRRSHASNSCRTWSSPKSRWSFTSSSSAAAGMLQEPASCTAGASALKSSCNAAEIVLRQHESGEQDMNAAATQQPKQCRFLSALPNPQPRLVNGCVLHAVAARNSEPSTPVKPTLHAGDTDCHTAAASTAANIHSDASPARVASLVDQLEQRLSTLQHLLHSPVDPEPVQQKQPCQAVQLHGLWHQGLIRPQQYSMHQQQHQPLQHTGEVGPTPSYEQLEQSMLKGPTCSHYSTAAAAAGTSCGGQINRATVGLDAATQTPPRMQRSSSGKRTVSCQVGGSSSKVVSSTYTRNTGVGMMLLPPFSQGLKGLQGGGMHCGSDNSSLPPHCVPASEQRCEQMATTSSPDAAARACGVLGMAAEHRDASSRQQDEMSGGSSHSNVKHARGVVPTSARLCVPDYPTDCCWPGVISNQQNAPSRDSTSIASSKMERASDADDVISGNCRRQLSCDQNALAAQQPAAEALPAAQHADVAAAVTTPPQQLCASCEHCKVAAAPKCSLSTSTPGNLSPAIAQLSSGSLSNKRQQCTVLNLSRGGTAVLRADQCSEGLLFALLLASKKPVSG